MPTTRLLALTCLVLLLGCKDDSDDFAFAAPSAGTPAGEKGWVGAWAAAPYGPFPLGPLSSVSQVDPLGLTAISLVQYQQARDQSFRMIVHPTMGGSRVRLRLSNLMGDRPMRFTSLQLAKRALGPALVPGSETPLRFDGEPEVVVAPGKEAISDPADFQFAFGDDLAISFHVVGDSGPMTWHAVSFGLNYVGLPGIDTTADASGASFVLQPTLGWFFISGLDVFAPDSLGAIVTLGDSITDGAFQVPETNTRWPDFLAQRLDAMDIAMSVLNQGINSNTVTAAGVAEGEEWKGPPAEARFARDVLQRAGVRSVVIFEGTNDLGGISGADIYAGIRRMVERAHAAGLCVVLGTIMPRDDFIFGWDRAVMEPRRQALNALIRATPGVEIADFDEVMSNPLDPARPHPLYFSPDLLHPTSLGFQVMADAVPIEALVPPPAGRCRRR